jgi:hypothetical protein
MHDKLCKLGGPLVRVAPVPDQKLGKVVELGDTEVCGERSLATFFAHNTNANVGSLDHGDVVATITNAADTLLGMLTDQVGNLGFLRRRATARNDSRQEHRNGDESRPELSQHQIERLAIDQEATISLVAQEI